MVAVDGAVCGVGTGVSMAFGVRAPHLCSSFTLFLLLLSFAKNETVSNFRSDPLFSENSQNNAIFRMVFWKEKKNKTSQLLEPIQFGRHFQLFNPDFSKRGFEAMTGSDT